MARACGHKPTKAACEGRASWCSSPVVQPVPPHSTGVVLTGMKQSLEIACDMDTNRESLL
eukprot:26723-Pleurochrysis_carterae.AAC.3